MRKIGIFILVISMLLLTSCKNPNDTVDNREDTASVIKSYEKSELGTLYDSKIGTLSGNRIFRLQWKNDEIFMCIADSEGNAIQEEKCRHNISSFDTDKEDKIYIFSETANKEKNCSEMKVYVYDLDISKVDEIDLGYGTLEEGGFTVRKDLDIDPNGRIILSKPYNDIKIYDFKGRLINTIDYDVIDLDVGENGELLVLGSKNKMQPMIVCMDPATGKSEWEHELDQTGYSAVVYNRWDKSIYIADGKGIFRYSADGNTKEYIFDSIGSSGISGFSVDDFRFDSDGSLLVASGSELFRSQRLKMSEQVPIPRFTS